MAKITIGELRHRISLTHRTVSTGSVGDVIETYGTPYATVYAHVAPISGSERFQQAMVGGSVVYRIYMRYRDDVVITDRITWGNHVLDVVAVIDLNGDHEWLRVEAVEAI